MNATIDESRAATMTAGAVVRVNLRIGFNLCDLTVCLLVAGSTKIKYCPEIIIIAVASMFTTCRPIRGVAEFH